MHCQPLSIKAMKLATLPHDSILASGCGIVEDNLTHHPKTECLNAITGGENLKNASISHLNIFKVS